MPPTVCYWKDQDSSFGGWLALPLEHFFLPLSNSANHGQADPNQQQHGLPQCQADCKGAGAEAVWGKTDPCLGELEPRKQGENLLKPTLHRKQGVSCVQHPLHSRTVTLRGQLPWVLCLWVQLTSLNTVNTCSRFPVHTQAVPCSHGCNFLERGEL